jgi:hypothetical protein
MLLLKKSVNRNYFDFSAVRNLGSLGDLTELERRELGVFAEVKTREVWCKIGF